MMMSSIAASPGLLGLAPEFYHPIAFGNVWLRKRTASTLGDPAQPKAESDGEGHRQMDRQQHARLGQRLARGRRGVAAPSIVADRLMCGGRARGPEAGDWFHDTQEIGPGLHKNSTAATEAGYRNLIKIRPAYSRWV